MVLVVCTGTNVDTTIHCIDSIDSIDYPENHFKKMNLITIGSNSSGNAYALDAGGEILLLEAGIRPSEVKRAINFRLSDIVGCAVTHAHGDHAKYATAYAKSGIHIYCNEDVAQKKTFPYGSCTAMQTGKTCNVGSFKVCPFENYHDVPIFGYLIHHPDMGIMLFSTDSYKIGQNMTGIDHYLIEANYSDELLKDNVWRGTIDKHQADRIMLSHMSLEYAIQYLRDCHAERAKTITICHLSDRNASPQQFQRTVSAAFGVPTYIAQQGTTIELNKVLI